MPVYPTGLRWIFKSEVISFKSASLTELTPYNTQSRELGKYLFQEVI